MTSATEQSLHIKAYEFVDSHAATLIGGNLARAVGFAALGFALAFLAAATRARRPELPKLAVPFALVGALLLAVAYVMQAAGVSSISTFLDGARTVDEAKDVGRGSISTTATFVQLGGQLALAVALVLISLNAMRCGLLTRFLGILGVIVGVLTIFPIGPVLVVQPVWLLALGLIFAGTWPGGVPPAWRTGRSEEWPAAQAAAERRRAARERGRGGRGARARAGAGARGGGRAAGPAAVLAQEAQAPQLIRILRIRSGSAGVRPARPRRLRRRAPRGRAGPSAPRPRAAAPSGRPARRAPSRRTPPAPTAPRAG